MQRLLLMPRAPNMIHTICICMRAWQCKRMCESENVCMCVCVGVCVLVCMRLCVKSCCVHSNYAS